MTQNAPDPENSDDGPSEPVPARFPSPGTRRCQRCGALNGLDFDTCIRCVEPLAEPRAQAQPAAPRWPPEPAGVLERPWAAKFILGLTFLTFVGQVMVTYLRGDRFPIPFLTGFHDIDLMRFGAMPVDLGAVAREPWLLLSCVFVHAGVLHIGLNMMGFMSFARISEPAVGPSRLFLAYVVTGLAGSAATIALSSFDAPGFLGILQRLISAQPRGVPYITTTLGASGAVFGMMGLVLGWLLRRRDSRWKTFAMEAVLFSVLFGFAVNASPRSTIVINNAAHIGGLLAGIVFGFVYAGGRRWAPPWLVNGGAAFCVLACIGSLILAQLSPRWRMVDQTLTSLPEGLPSDSTVTAPNR